MFSSMTALRLQNSMPFIGYVDNVVLVNCEVMAIVMILFILSFLLLSFIDYIIFDFLFSDIVDNCWNIVKQQFFFGFDRRNIVSAINYWDFLFNRLVFLYRKILYNYILNKLNLCITIVIYTIIVQYMSTNKINYLCCINHVYIMIKYK